MIGLDTNILVRFVMQDDPAGSRTANRIFERELTTENPGYVSLAVVLETVWVLSSIYELEDQDVAAAIQNLIAKDVVVVQAEADVFEAAKALETSSADFADALVAALARSSGCTHTLTFDKRAARLPGFQLAR